MAFDRDHWPDDISLAKMLELAADWSRFQGMRGQAVYSFVLGSAIVHLQKTGLDDANACKMGLLAANRYREEHPEEFDPNAGPPV